MFGWETDNILNYRPFSRFNQQETVSSNAHMVKLVDQHRCQTQMLKSKIRQSLNFNRTTNANGAQQNLPHLMPNAI